MKKTLRTISIIFLFFIPAFALAEKNYIDADENVKDIETVANALKTKTGIPVVFPALVPKITNKNAKGYFANSDDKSDNQQYTLYVDYSSDCHGAHYCNAGTIRAHIGAKPEMFYSMNNQPLTTQVTLALKLIGYYTPGHPMGSYFPANMQWRDGNTLYSISWQSNDNDAEEEKAMLLKLVNSAITAGTF